MPDTVLVLPHYNEAERFDPAPLRAFVAEHAQVRFVLVDDGSTDGTLGCLEDFAAAAPEGRVEVLALAANGGKAEAVRRGMLRAMELAPRYLGFWDGDLATPLDALGDFETTLERHPSVEMVFGARVQLLGRSIDRRPLRHYFGRVFATAASLTLGIPIYDTQCGAKLFRASAETAELFSAPFLTGWTFDVEIIARRIRALRGAGEGTVLSRIRELPLERWQDVDGSKVRALDFPRALFALLRIRRHYLAGG